MSQQLKLYQCYEMLLNGRLLFIYVEAFLVLCLVDCMQIELLATVSVLQI